MAPEDPPKARRKGIQSILTGFRIVDFLVGAGQPVPLKQISEGTGLSASKLQFYLISLIEVGIVVQDRASGHYGLGPYTLQLGIIGLQRFDVYAAAAGRIGALAAETGHSVFMGVWGSEGPTIVHRAQGPLHGAIFELRLGAVLPLLRSALGRLFLAYLPEAMTQSALERELKQMAAGPVLAEGLPKSREAVQAMGAAVRSAGLAVVRGGLLADHTAISAPVLDHTGRILAGVTVMGHVNVLDDDPGGEVARRLLALTQSVTREAGASTHHYLRDFPETQTGAPSRSK